MPAFLGGVESTIFTALGFAGRGLSVDSIPRVTGGRAGILGHRDRVAVHVLDQDALPHGEEDAHHLAVGRTVRILHGKVAAEGEELLPDLELDRLGRDQATAILVG